MKFDGADQIASYSPHKSSVTVRGLRGRHTHNAGTESGRGSSVSLAPGAGDHHPTQKYVDPASKYKVLEKQ